MKVDWVVSWLLTFTLKKQINLNGNFFKKNISIVSQSGLQVVSVIYEVICSIGDNCFRVVAIDITFYYRFYAFSGHHY